MRRECAPACCVPGTSPVPTIETVTSVLTILCLHALLALVAVFIGGRAVLASLCQACSTHVRPAVMCHCRSNHAIIPPKDHSMSVAMCHRCEPLV